MSADCLSALMEAHSQQTPVVWTALVETRGSTPQKAGACMLVFADGSQVGTLGGGCVEAEVKRKALKNLKKGKREIITFQLDSDYGWDDGLICGGRMTMLIDPVCSEESLDYFKSVSELKQQGLSYTEAILLESDEEERVPAGSSYLLDSENRLIAKSGSDELPEGLIENLKPLSERPRPYVVKKVSYLPVLERCQLFIVGAGHIGQKVAHLAAEADFDVWVVDDREQYCNQERFPTAKRLIVAPIEEALVNLEVNRNSFAIVVTRGHNHDEEALFHLAQKELRYLGMIGSKRKIKLILEDLISEGISPERLAEVYAPLGFDIGSQTVPEIAISIMAEMIAIRNLGSLPTQIRPDSYVEQLKLDPKP